MTVNAVLYGRSNLGSMSHIEPAELGPATSSGYTGERFLGRGLLLQIVNQHQRALTGKPLSNRSADPARRPGHQRNLTLQSVAHASTSRTQLQSPGHTEIRTATRA